MNLKYIILFLILFLICVGIYYFKLIKENMETNIDLKNLDAILDNSEIPLHIYQTWHSNTLPQYMQECVNKLKKDNPEFSYHFYNDFDCREYIKDNFNKDVLHAFDKLIPGAYKADLWRYCILYKKGGIYLDIKYQCENGFKLIQLTDKEYFVKDIPKLGRLGIYNAFMICKPGNKILLNCIDKIVENIKHKYYGSSPLEISGPLLMSKYFSPLDINNLQLQHVQEKTNFYITNNGIKILKIYPEYRSEQRLYQKNKYYAELWHKRRVYK